MVSRLDKNCIKFACANEQWWRNSCPAIGFLSRVLHIRFVGTRKIGMPSYIYRALRKTYNDTYNVQCTMYIQCTMHNFISCERMMQRVMELVLHHDCIRPERECTQCSSRHATWTSLLWYICLLDFSCSQRWWFKQKERCFFPQA